MGDAGNVYLFTLQNGEGNTNIRSCPVPDAQRRKIRGLRGEVEIKGPWPMKH